MKHKNGCTRRHSRKRSNINHTLEDDFSHHIDKTVLQTEHFLGITAEDSFLMATVGLLPKLYLTGDSFADFPFHIIEVLNDPTLVDEPAKPVGAMAVGEMKMIPDEIGALGLTLLGLSVGIEVVDCHGVGVQSPQRNVFLYQWTVCPCICSYRLPYLMGYYQFMDVPTNIITSVCGSSITIIIKTLTERKKDYVTNNICNYFYHCRRRSNFLFWYCRNRFDWIYSISNRSCSFNKKN